MESVKKLIKSGRRLLFVLGATLLCLVCLTVDAAVQGNYLHVAMGVVLSIVVGGAMLPIALDLKDLNREVKNHRQKS